EALFAVGNNRFEGAEKIRAFYARRRQHGTTTTRHLVGNLRVLRDDARCVWTVGVMSLYRAVGRPPFLWVRPPAMIADFEAQCVLGDDRLWRFQSHVLRPIFVGSDLPASISIDPDAYKDTPTYRTPVPFDGALSLFAGGRERVGCTQPASPRQKPPHPPRTRRKRI